MVKEFIKAKGIKKTYDHVKAVDNLDITVNKGEIFGLIGPNGAGKSTAIECILGTKKKDSGSVDILNMDPINNRKRVFEEIGVQFQDSYYPDRIKVKEMCQLVASLYTKSIDWREMLSKFGLSDKSKQMISELSGGERQKLSVILALLHKPKIVFLDELTTGLDPSARRQMWNFLKSLNMQGLTIFLTSHYMDEVHYLCDRISIIDKGKIITTGTPDDVIKAVDEGSLEEAYLKLIAKKGEIQ
ncbi:MAG: ABC transporter ATP-binding protein [Firmicutes bacterium]|nr:ABC transporter ATP-binding protein [Bacillota bacterium]